MQLSKKVFTVFFIAVFLTLPQLVVAEAATENLIQSKKGVSEMFFSNQGKTQTESKPASVSSLVGSDKEKPSFTSLFTNVFKGLLYCIATLLFGVAVYRRFFETKISNNEELIKILGKKNITSKSMLVVVETAGQQFLLSQMQEQITLLAELKKPENFDADLMAAFDETPVAEYKQAVANCK